MIADNERIGKFAIDTSYIEDSSKRECLYKLFSYMIVLRAECLLYRNAIEYVAISPLFDPRKRGEIIPIYEIIFEDAQFDLERNRYLQRIRAIRKDQGKPVSARLMTLDPASEG